MWHELEAILGYVVSIYEFECVFWLVTCWELVYWL